jgi:hypothetical protein
MPIAADRDDLTIQDLPTPTPEDTGLHDLSELWCDIGGSD